MEEQEIAVTGAPGDSANFAWIRRALLGIILALLLGVGAVAWLFRYEPLPQSANGALVWDRWTHRFCVAVPPRGRPVLLCNGAEANVVTDLNNKLDTVAPAALFPGQQAGAPKWDADLTRLRAAGFSEKDIGELATSLRDIMRVRGTPREQIDAYFGDYQFPP